MHQIFRTIGCVVFVAGCAWVVQTVGLAKVGLFAVSPSFFLIGAAISGAGVGAIACTRLLQGESLPAKRLSA